MSSPSRQVGTSPAGGRSVSTARLPSSHAVPTSGWPASGSSTVGVKIRSAPSRVVDEDRLGEPEVGGDGLAVGGRDRGAVEHDAERVAAGAVGADEDAEGVERRGDHAGEDGERRALSTSDMKRASVKLCFMLDPRRLLILDAVARAGSMTAAAAALAYTPSAVSQAIAALEREAGAALVRRGPRGVRMTTPAPLLARHAAALRERLDLAAEELADVVGLRAGRLRLAAFPSAGSVLMPPAIAAFHARHPVSS